MFVIYWQLRHVYSYINFSRIAVRNNHAITETLCLFVGGMLFPFLPGAAKWKRDGKDWFEKEVSYQVYEDGTFLQFSMNYHRVVVQLLTWGIVLATGNGEKLAPVVAERAQASNRFLHACMNTASGELPNYGANDGALFFPLNDQSFRDYRPQLQALANATGESVFDDAYEDAGWYGLTGIETLGKTDAAVGIHTFQDGGYYVLREANTITFVRCGKHKDRPSQADNLHLDIWIGDKNIFRDGGSYRYNTDENVLRYFFGTASHNSLMLGDNDQMQKGKRFIWYYWSQAVEGSWTEYEDHYFFKGAIHAFRQVAPGIVHTRTIKKSKHLDEWQVTDTVNHLHGLPIHQLWNPLPEALPFINISSVDGNGKSLQVKNKPGWYSGLYGVKEETVQLIFSSFTNTITTTISVKEF
jgi:hypothetical protein